ncbi:MAG: hypothetical protein P4N60_21375 [Verrucomicrobiae bacterium]|nr:hypothetical protein [Verrucomicrobiae bacterium]
MIRIGQIAGTGRSIFGRYVFINNFCFFLVIANQSASRNDLKEVRRQIRISCPGIVFLDPHVKQVKISVSSVTAMDRYKDSALAQMDKWHEHLQKQN